MHRRHLISLRKQSELDDPTTSSVWDGADSRSQIVDSEMSHIVKLSSVWPFEGKRASVRQDSITPDLLMLSPWTCSFCRMLQATIIPHRNAAVRPSLLSRVASSLLFKERNLLRAEVIYQTLHTNWKKNMLWEYWGLLGVLEVTGDTGGIGGQQ